VRFSVAYICLIKVISSKVGDLSSTRMFVSFVVDEDDDDDEGDEGDMEDVLGIEINVLPVLVSSPFLAI